MKYDKKLHVFAGFIVGILATYILENPFSGSITSVIAALAKVLYDKIAYSSFDVIDMLYIIIGGILGSIVIFMYQIGFLLQH